MKGKRHTTEERIRILRKAEAGKTVAEVIREHGISEQTFYRWRKEFGMMDVNQAKRLKELEKEWSIATSPDRRSARKGEASAEAKREAEEDRGRPGARHGDPAGGAGKKAVSPGHKRQVAEGFVSGQRCSGRQACRYFRLHRSTYRYEGKEPDAWMVRLKSAVRRVSEEHSAWGYPKIAKLLREEGWKVGKKLVATLRREMGLRVPKRRPKRKRRGMSTGLPTKATHRGHVWTWDFIHDRTVRGGSLKMLTVVDEYTRENHLIHVDRRIRAAEVRRQLERLISIHGAPEHIRSDNGSEFIQGALQDWMRRVGIKTLYIEPGSPWQPERKRR